MEISEHRALSNAQIADRLAGLAQLLSTQKENRYKVKAYHRAAIKIRSLSESLDEMVKEDADLTRFAGIGSAIASAIREIVLTGSLSKLDRMRSEAAPEVASLVDYPRLDPKRVLRIYKKLDISSIDALRQKLESGAIAAVLGLRMAEHVRQGLNETGAILLYRADDLHEAVERFLVDKCNVEKLVVVGDYRRRVEVISEMEYLIHTTDFPTVVSTLQRYGGLTKLLNHTTASALFALSSGITLRVSVASPHNWGLSLIQRTGSGPHLEKL